MENLPLEILPMLGILPAWFTWLAGLALLFPVFAVIYIFIKYLLPLIRRFLKKFSADKDEDNGIKLPPVGKRINSIYSSYSDEKEYRAGLLALSSLMKNFFETGSGLNIEEMEASEIGKALGSREGTFFRNLEEALFSRPEPTDKTLKDMCRYAKKTARKRQRDMEAAGD